MSASPPNLLTVWAYLLLYVPAGSGIRSRGASPRPRSAAVPLAAGLHLKSSVNYLGRNTLLLTQSFAEMGVFSRYDQIVVDDDEAYAANTLWVNGRLLTPAGFPKTKAKLLAAGFDLIEIDVSEARKMDGGLSCMSLRF